MTEVKYCVEVIEACKYYSKKAVLNNFSMKVEEGSVYALLGPSGCGKTTLLGALVDRIELDCGYIKMTTKSTSEIGYMPQEVALYPEFSLKEHLIYYGRIYSMTTVAILSKSEELREFLQLPPLTTIISKMSGGQQRRVSLCITLLHSPKLLILDEPTVGVDVLLANSIWENLLYMSQNEGKTIILTTHYIEEARRSNTIGLMRNGILLTQDSPDTLMEFHNCNNLEQVFLKFCEQNLEEISDEKIEVQGYEKKPKHHLKKTKILNAHCVLAHILKNLYWMRRNITNMLFTFALPVIQCVLVSITVGETPSNLSLATVTYEVPGGIHECSASLWTKPLSCDVEDVPFSCYIIKKIMDKDISIVQYASLEEAKKSVQKNYQWGVLYFNKEYTSSLKERFRLDLKNDTIMENSEIKIWMDNSDTIISSTLKTKIIKSLFDFIGELSDGCSWQTKGAALPIGFEEPIYGSYESTYRQSMTPANAILFMFYFPILFTAGALITEKSSGLLSRGLVAGLSLLDIAIGHMVLQCIIFTVQIAFVWIVFYYMFNNIMIGDVYLCLLLLFLVGICGMFHGFTIVAMCDDFTSASCLAFGRYFPIFLMSGAIWPVEGMHYILRTISNYSPLTKAVEAFRAVSVRGWSLFHPTVYSGMITVAVWTAIYGLITVMFIKFKGIKL
ncbi:ABC transporter G family member 20 [Halyomorpha halys]|uniref:ABC transporter G family member 20 n=1 Tax=Halyomorpha halys TaxID=286706 RepID=UPI0006D4EAB4